MHGFRFEIAPVLRVASKFVWCLLIFKSPSAATTNDWRQRIGSRQVPYVRRLQSMYVQIVGENGVNVQRGQIFLFAIFLVVFTFP